MPEPIILEVFTDYVCPWCYLGDNRVKKLKQNYDITVQLVHFPLHPETPAEGRTLLDLFGGGPDNIKAKNTHMKGIMEATAKKWLLLSTALPAVGLVGMLLARQYLRTGFLARQIAGNFDIHQDWHVQMQTQPMLVFGITLVGGLLVIALMLILVLRARPAPTTAGQDLPDEQVQQNPKESE